MIRFIFGGEPSDPVFQEWLNQSAYVYKFSPFKNGEFRRFAAAVLHSTEQITKVDYWGKESTPTVANDSMVVHVVCDSAVEFAENQSRIEAFLILAKDAGLEFDILKYPEADPDWDSRMNIIVARAYLKEVVEALAINGREAALNALLQ